MDAKYGIIGGGQLGAMLIDYGIHKLDPNACVKVLTQSLECSCAYVKHKNTKLILCNSLNNRDEIEAFVKQCDYVTWETEHFAVYNNEKFTSSTEFLRIIQNKQLQKQFYTDNSINTVSYANGLLDIDYFISFSHEKIHVKSLNNNNEFVCEKIVIKNDVGGYDGKGVMVVDSTNIEKYYEILRSSKNIIEEYIEDKLEVSVIWACRNQELIRFDPCLMEFNEANMLEYCFSFDLLKNTENTKNIDTTQIETQAIVFSYYVMKKLLPFLKNDIVAIEMFYHNDKFYVNEIAPRVHNSGHHTIHAYTVSQFEIAARLLMNYPLARPKLLHQYLMYNVIGPTNLHGKYAYRDNFDTYLDNYFIDYHKNETRPYRKMGHLTLLFSNDENGIETIKKECKVKIIHPSQVPVVGIIMGSKSDMKIMESAKIILENFQVPYEFLIVSAHRTPKRLYKYAETAKSRGLKVIIAGAGGAAHLPGMIASLTNVPVIGVPIRTESLNGLDSLYSIVQMPGNVPVASMAINGSKNAALFALQILGITDHDIFEQLNEYKLKIAKEAIVIL